MKQPTWIVVVLGSLLLPVSAVSGGDQPPPPPPPGPGSGMNTTQSISDVAQRTTLAFDGLAMMTGNLDAQSFFPPGKVADYTGFQYLRDNDPDNMGHNTSFLTRVAENVIYILTDAQLAQLAALAVPQQDQFNLYGYKRFALMKAFRRLLDGDIPSGSTGLSLNAVKQASRELYLLDGQISFDRALLYANIYSSMDSTQKAYLDAMKGKGWKSWPDTSTTAYQAVIQPKMKSLPQGSAVLVMTYASDLFSWYAGSVDADVYFCPERHGTYYGGFYIKDAPAVGHEGYSISEQLTATAGSALCDSSQGYVTQDQAAVISSLVDTQRNNLYAGTVNIVQVRTQIATLLRSLLASTASSDDVKNQVLALSATYGELDGENNYNYATVFAKVYKTMTSEQMTKLMALRKSIMSGTYADGTPFDYSVCTTPFLYSSPIREQSALAPYIANADYLFNRGSLLLTSDVGADGGTLPIEYTYDGNGSSPPLSWSNVPAGTQEFALLMTTLPGDGTTKWNWVLYNIPGSATGLAKNSLAGTGGKNSDTPELGYAPPCSKGPGAKLYTFTLYALSATPSLSSADQVTGDVLTKAISSLTLGSAALNLSYTRTGPVADFTYAQSAPMEIAFISTSGRSTTSWAWDFGDGTTSTDQNPTHVYSIGGAIPVSLTVGNEFGSNTVSHVLTITKPAGTPNTPPALPSPITANPPVGTEGQAVTFSAAATDADGDIPSFAWDFGDGTTGTGASVSHTYTSSGIYTVTLDLSDGTAVLSEVMYYAVSSAEAPVGSDNGGNDLWYASSPNVFSVTRAYIGFNFGSTSKHSLRLSGTVPVTKFFKPQNGTVTFVIGGIRKDFTLNARSYGISGTSKFQLLGRMRKGVFKATPAKFILTMTGETLLPALEEFGFANRTTAKAGEQIGMPVTIMVNTLGYETDKTVLYKATAGKSGFAK